MIGNVSFPNVPTPTTPGALQPAPAGGVETFVMKLNDTGSDLVYSTFVGGSESDYGSAIAVDSFGQAYVTGRTFRRIFRWRDRCNLANSGARYSDQPTAGQTGTMFRR